MKRNFLLWAVALSVFFSCAGYTPSVPGSTNTNVVNNATNTNLPPAGQIIDHRHVDASILTIGELDAARGLDVYFRHASTGYDVLDGVEWLSLSNSTRYYYTRIMNPTAEWYALSNGFCDEDGDNPEPRFFMKITNFIKVMTNQSFATNMDVAFFKMCFIDDVYSGTAEDAFQAVLKEMTNLQQKYPATVFVWWTMPLWGSGSAACDAYNEIVRAYCATNGQWLYDIASIECHDTNGDYLTNSSGFEYIPGHYSTDGGHPDKEICGLRLGNAWWVLMARIAASR